MPRGGYTPSWYNSQAHQDWLRVREAGWLWNAEERRWIHRDGRTARNRREIIAAMDAGVDPRPCNPRGGGSGFINRGEQERVDRAMPRQVTEEELLAALDHADRVQAARRTHSPIVSAPWQKTAPDWQPNHWEA